uniref:KTSC domain-containing protein n=1 Tax=Syphacia muris TaxID=451379 RepID=A0A0N5AZQ5_9BILA
MKAPSHYEHAVAQSFFRQRGGKFWVEVRRFSY